LDRIQRRFKRDGCRVQRQHYRESGGNRRYGEAGNRILLLCFHAQASNTAATNYGYWQPYETTGYNRLDAVQRQETWDSQQSAIAAVVEYQYDNPYANGNRTMEMHWDNTKPGAGTAPSLGNLTTSNSQVLTRAYNGFGSLTDIYSPEVRTHVTYGPHPSDPNNPGPRIRRESTTLTARRFNGGGPIPGATITAARWLRKRMTTIASRQATASTC